MNDYLGDQNIKKKNTKRLEAHVLFKVIFQICPTSTTTKVEKITLKKILSLRYKKIVF